METLKEKTGSSRRVRRKPESRQREKGRKQTKRPQRPTARSRNSPRHQATTDTPPKSSSTNDGQPISPSTAIWDVLKEAKKKQDLIRNRMRKYGDENDDSDYCDSHSSDNNNKNGNLNDKYSDEDAQEDDPYVPEIRIDMQHLEDDPYVPEIRIDMQQEYTQRSEGYSNRPSKSSSSRSTKSSTSKSRVRKGSSNDGKDTKNQIKDQIHSRAYHSAQDEEDPPALTPDEAIKLVMNRHMYVSDSEDSQNGYPVTKPPTRKLSSSTNETAAASDSGHNITPMGKRVLTLPKKKYREDTHPRTSKNKGSKRSNPRQEPHAPKSPQRSRSGELSLTSSKNQDDHRLQQQHVSRSLPSSVSPSQEDVPQGNQSKDRRQPKQIEDKSIKEDREQMNHSDNGRKYDGKKDKIITHKDHEPKLETARKEIQNYTTLVKTSSGQQRRRASALANEAMLKKKLMFDGNDRYGDDSDKLNSSELAVDGYEDCNVTEEREDDGGGSTDPINGDDNEEDLLNHSWATARQSPKSTVSKYSKVSSTELWLKATQEEGSESDQDDNNSFFDAIQESGEPSSSRPSNEDGSPPPVVSDFIDEHDRTDNDKYYDDDDDDSFESGRNDNRNRGGWAGKLGDFVGKSDAAFSGSTDVEDNSSNVYDESIDSTLPSERTDTVASTINESMQQHKSPAKHAPNNTKTVNSREIEIIRKCQEQMEQNRREAERLEWEASRNNRQNIELRRQEEVARARVQREVIAYRTMMEGMGKGDKLAPLNSKDAARDYDDRLALDKALAPTENKSESNKTTTTKMEKHVIGSSCKDFDGCDCACIIS